MINEQLTPWCGKPILAPLTKGGNLPFRRLCVELGAKITVSEMAYARKLVRGAPRERVLLKKAPEEQCFGVQIAARCPDEAYDAGMMAVDQGAHFLDINAGCPIHDTTRRGLGAQLLDRPKVLIKLVESLAARLPIPVTVKIRTGWTDKKIVAAKIAKQLEEAGTAMLTIHGRTRQQRYTRAADWQLIAEIAEQLTIPVIGNGDILTHYEARHRTENSKIRAVMVGRGALIKPWIFSELESNSCQLLTAEERIAIYFRLAELMKEHFRDDELGFRRTMQFLPWHFSFFSRYAPLPEEIFEEQARLHPLIQTRQGGQRSLPLLEQLLCDPREEMHQRIAEQLWQSHSAEQAAVKLSELAEQFPPQPAEADEFTVSAG